MPGYLKFLCGLYAALLVAHAGLAPFVEDGMWVIFPLVIDAALIWLIWAFAHRRTNTLSWLSTYCAIAVVMLPFLALFAEGRSANETLQLNLLWVEAAASAAMLIALRREATKTWFNAKPAA